MGFASETSGEGPSISINIVTLSIMKAIGVDAEKARSWAVSAMQGGGSGALSPDNADERVFLSSENQIVLRFQHEDQWHIDHDDLILPGHYPCSLLTLCAGKYLRDVVDIPVLRELDIPILEARDENGMIRFQIMNPDTLISLSERHVGIDI